MRRGLKLVVSLLASAILPVPSAHAQPSLPGQLTILQFRDELTTLGDMVRKADNAAAAQEIAARLPPRWRVAFGDREVDVETQWLSAALRDASRRTDQWQRTRTAIGQRLTLLEEQAASAARADARSPDARAVLSRILERDEFQQSAASRWREQLRQRVGQWLEDLWARLGGGLGMGRDAGVVLAWIAALSALIGLTVFLVRSLAARPQRIELSLVAEGQLRPRARDLALRALEAARAGNGRDVVRLGYRAALVRFEEQGAWRVDDTRTPREYWPLLGESDARRPLLIDLTRRFERIWYGNRPVQPEDSPRVAAHLEELGCLRPGERAI